MGWAKENGGNSAQKIVDQKIDRIKADIKTAAKKLGWQHMMDEDISNLFRKYELEHETYKRKHGERRVLASDELKTTGRFIPVLLALTEDAVSRQIVNDFGAPESPEKTPREAIEAKIQEYVESDSYRKVILAKTHFVTVASDKNAAGKSGDSQGDSLSI